ncbi:MAG: CarD family transcriptional regulator [Eubacteriales bacterium]|nr:CarD family transcriptional regulator [Eubacteriales bacterium]
MFEKGEYIVYGHNGICRVEDITHLSLSGADKERIYYVLVPLNSSGSVIYYPADKENSKARRTMTAEEALELLDEIQGIEQMCVLNEKLREEIYKKALYSGDCREWVAIIKTLYLRRQDRLHSGKRVAAVDERYLKMAEEALYSEMAFAMGRKKEEMEDVITDHIRRKKEAMEAR